MVCGSDNWMVRESKNKKGGCRKEEEKKKRGSRTKRGQQIMIPSLKITRNLSFQIALRL